MHTDAKPFLKTGLFKSMKIVTLSTMKRVNTAKARS